MASSSFSSFPNQAGLPFNAELLPFLTQLFSGATSQGQGGLGGCPSMMSKLAEMYDEGMVEYTRQMSMQEQHESKKARKEEQTSTATTTTSSSFPSKETLSKSMPEARESKEDGKFTVDINLGAEVKPQDLQLSIKDRELIVDVKTEMRSEDGSTRLYQELTKKIPLPDEVSVEEVRSNLKPNGILRIEAPLPQAGSSKSLAVEIPVVSMDVVEEKTED